MVYLAKFSFVWRICTSVKATSALAASIFS
jgi:hypothetical protein